MRHTSNQLRVIILIFFYSIFNFEGKRVKVVIITNHDYQINVLMYLNLTITLKFKVGIITASFK